MARKRDYAREYARRQARARTLGYQSYYARRIRAGAPPSAPRPVGERLRELRGHASAADLRAVLRSGRAEILVQEPGPRNRKGQVTEVRVTVQLTDGSQRTYRIRSRTLSDPGELRSLRLAIRDSGTDIYVSPSPDVIGLGRTIAEEAVA